MSLSSLSFAPITAPSMRAAAPPLAAFVSTSQTAPAFALSPSAGLSSNGATSTTGPTTAAGSSLAAAAPAAPNSREAALRAKITSAAKSFESQFLGVMIGQMFEGVETQAPFGGGAGEKAFKSFMTDAFARSIAEHGGVGLAAPVARSMLKRQGLSA